MPLVSYRASVEAVLHEIHEVAGWRQSAKQVLTPSRSRLRSSAMLETASATRIEPLGTHAEREARMSRGTSSSSTHPSK